MQLCTYNTVKLINLVVGILFSIFASVDILSSIDIRDLDEHII